MSPALQEASGCAEPAPGTLMVMQDEEWDRCPVLSLEPEDELVVSMCRSGYKLDIEQYQFWPARMVDSIYFMRSISDA